MESRRRRFQHCSIFLGDGSEPLNCPKNDETDCLLLASLSLACFLNSLRWYADITHNELSRSEARRQYTLLRTARVTSRSGGANRTHLEIYALTTLLGHKTSWVAFALAPGHFAAQCVALGAGRQPSVKAGKFMIAKNEFILWKSCPRLESERVRFTS